MTSRMTHQKVENTTSSTDVTIHAPPATAAIRNVVKNSVRRSRGTASAMVPMPSAAIRKPITACDGICTIRVALSAPEIRSSPPISAELRSMAYARPRHTSASPP